MKKLIRKKLDFNIHELEGSLEDAIQVLQSYLILDGEVEVSIEEVDYDTTTIVLYGTREETDQEEAKRIEKEEKHAAWVIKNLAAKKEKIVKEAKKLGLKVTES